MYTFNINLSIKPSSPPKFTSSLHSFRHSFDGETAMQLQISMPSPARNTSKVHQKHLQKWKEQQLVRKGELGVPAQGDKKKSPTSASTIQSKSGGDNLKVRILSQEQASPVTLRSVTVAPSLYSPELRCSKFTFPPHNLLAARPFLWSALRSSSSSPCPLASSVFSVNVCPLCAVWMWLPPPHSSNPVAASLHHHHIIIITIKLPHLSSRRVTTWFGVNSVMTSALRVKWIHIGQQYKYCVCLGSPCTLAVR